MVSSGIFCMQDKTVEKYFAALIFSIFWKTVRIKYFPSPQKLHVFVGWTWKERTLRFSATPKINSQKDIPKLSSSLENFNYIGNMVVYRFSRTVGERV